MQYFSNIPYKISAFQLVEVAGNYFAAKFSYHFRASLKLNTEILNPDITLELIVSTEFLCKSSFNWKRVSTLLELLHILPISFSIELLPFPNIT